MSKALFLRVGLLLSCLLPMTHLEAQDTPSDTRFTPLNCEKWEARTRAMAESSDPVQRSLGELLQEPELSYCQTRTVRVEDPEKPEEPWFDWNPDFTALAGLMQIIAIVLLVALVIWLLMRLDWGSWGRQEDDRAGKSVPGDRSRDLTLPAEDELDRVVEAAETAWAAGDRRRALSLLYRGALVRIWPQARDRHARTEREVLRELQSNQAPDSLQTTMRMLTRLWQQSAWAHRPPSDKDFSDARDRWVACFSAPETHQQ